MNRSMIRLRLLPVTLFLAALSFSDPVWGEAATSQPMATAAQCVLKITRGTGLTAISPEVISVLLNSVSVKGKTLRDVLNVAPGGNDGFVDINFEFLSDVSLNGPFQGADAVLCRLEIEYVDDPSTYARGADEFLRVLVEHLADVLKDAGKSEFKMMEERAQITKAERMRVEHQLREIQALHQALIEEAGRTDLERDSILSEQHDLEEQIAESELELAGYSVRRQAIEAQIARISEMMGKSAPSDPMLEALQKVVEVREQQFRGVQTQFKAELVSSNDLANAETELASARAELWQYQRELAERSAGGSLAELNAELNRMTISEAETKGNLQLRQERLRAMKDRKLLELSDRYEREVRIQREVAEDAFEEALRRQDEIERLQNAWRPPVVTVIGAQ